MVGQNLGPYQVVSKLGEGGMGEVYRARDTKLGRDVAVKLLPPRFSADPERVARFEREARTLASLNHPRIAQVYSLEAADDRLVLVLEFVPGMTLADRLTRGPLPVREALGLGRQIAEGLDAAHERGIVHRDLKPANVQVTPAGQVKILDFGLAKALAGEDGDETSDSPTITAGLTRLGAVVGTPGYMSPEQARGTPTDKRADVWAFGCLLYECLTGERAFGGTTASAAIAAVLEGEPDSTKLPAGTPPDVRRVLRRCLQKDPRRRLRDIGDAISDLDPDRGEASPAPGSGRHPRSAWGLGLAAVLLVAITLVATIQVQRLFSGPGGPAVATVLQIPAPPGTASLAGAPALSEDGRQVAWVAEERDGRARIWVYSLDTGVTRPLPGSEGAANVSWSPDAHSVVFNSQASLKIVDLSSTTARTVVRLPGVSQGATWSAQSGILFSGRYSLFRVPPSGGTPTPVASVNHAYHENSLRWPQFLPDGRHFLYVARSGRAEESGAYVGTLGGAPVRLFPTSSKVAYAPPGYLLAIRDGVLVARTFDLRTLAVGSDETVIGDPVGAQPNGLLGLFSVSANGTLAYFSHPVNPSVQLQWVDRSGVPIAPAGPAGNYSNFRIAPDGERIVVDMANAHRNVRDVWILNKSGTPPTRLTFGGSDDWIPVWSPDGQKVVFMSYRNGVGDLYVKTVAGSAPENAVVLSENQKVPSDWSSDGRFIAYWSDTADTRGDVWAVASAPSGSPIAIACSPANERQPRFAPDGTFVAYSSDESGQDEVYVQPFPPTGAKWQVSIAGGSDPAWSRDGRELYFVDAGNRLVGVPVSSASGRFSTGRQQSLFGVGRPGGGTAVYDVAPDGRRFLVRTWVRPEAQPVTVVLNWPARLKR
jgi:eukaryotic-like serine/threonine-protein kinase